jgi:hypothetical protein
MRRFFFWLAFVPFLWLVASCDGSEPTLSCSDFAQNVNSIEGINADRQNKFELNFVSTAPDKSDLFEVSGLGDIASKLRCQGDSVSAIYTGQDWYKLQYGSPKDDGNADHWQRYTAGVLVVVAPSLKDRSSDILAALVDQSRKDKKRLDDTGANLEPGTAYVALPNNWIATAKYYDERGISVWIERDEPTGAL